MEVPAITISESHITNPKIDGVFYINDAATDVATSVSDRVLYWSEVSWMDDDFAELEDIKEAKILVAIPKRIQDQVNTYAYHRLSGLFSSAVALPFPVLYVDIDTFVPLGNDINVPAIAGCVAVRNVGVVVGIEPYTDLDASRIENQDMFLKIERLETHMDVLYQITESLHGGHLDMTFMLGHTVSVEGVLTGFQNGVWQVKVSTLEMRMIED